MKKILVIGSTTVDVTIRLDHLPVPEEDIQPYSQSMSIGGCAYNVANMLSRFQIPHELFSPVGTGFYATLVEEAFAKEGREVRLRAQEENGVCYCLVDAKGDRTFMAVHGAEYRFREEWLVHCPIEEQDLIYVCGLELEEKTGDVLLKHLKRARKGTILFAPGARIAKLQQDRLEQILNLSVLLHMNKKEARILLERIGVHDVPGKLSELASCLHTRTGQPVILTDGADGSVFCTNEGTVFEPALSIQQIDGNGAGDAHCGAVLAGLSRKDCPSVILKRANRAGALLAGLHGSTCTQEEFEEFGGLS